MRETITISLPASLRKNLDRAVKEDQLNRSDVIREALRRYFSIREFRKLRGVFIAMAEKKELFRDEDVFDLVS